MNDIARIVEPAELTTRADRRKARAERIRLHGARIASDVIAIGRELIEERDESEHGEWLDWLADEFGWSERTARNFVYVAEAFGKSANFADMQLPISALYELAAPKVTEPVRAAVLERLQQQPAPPSLADIRQVLAEALDERDSVAADATAKRILDLEVQQRTADERWRIEKENALAELKRVLEADASKTIADREQALSEALAELEREKPKLSELDPVKVMCEMIGKSRLTARQLHGLALALGRPVNDGKTVYPPQTVEEVEANQAIISQSVKVVDAFRLLIGLGDGAEFRRSMNPVMRKEAVRLAPAVETFMSAFNRMED